MKVSDDEMDRYLKTASLDDIRNAAERDPEIIRRGWRNGTVPWISSAMLFDTYEKTVPVLLELGADINATDKDMPDDDAVGSSLADSDIKKVRFLLEHGAIPNKRHVVRHAVISRKVLMRI